MIVVDSAVVVDALVLDGADAIRNRLALDELHAPMLLDYEVTSAVRGLVLGKHVSAARGLDALADYDDLPIVRWPDSAPLRRRAFELRRNVSTYDGAYVALAEVLDCELLTRDRRLGRSRGHAAVITVM